MMSAEQHQIEQDAITAMCEAGICDHPECQDDRYENELVDRAAPRWAWDIIDDTLAKDGQSNAFDASLRDDINAATFAMQTACERADDEPISRAEIDAQHKDDEPARVFEVTLWEKVTYTAEVKADSEDEAQEIVEEMVSEGEIESVSQGYCARIITESEGGDHV